MTSAPRNFWSPLTAGIALGLGLLATFVISGHGLGASGSFTNLSAVVAAKLAPGWAAANGYFGPILAGRPLDAWINWEVAGVCLGALLGSLGSGRFRWTVERGPAAGRLMRLALAFGGGAVTGFGTRLVRGCTSGLGLSGGATLAVAAFYFLVFFFLAGWLASLAARRVWR